MDKDTLDSRHKFNPEGPGAARVLEDCKQGPTACGGCMAAPNGANCPQHASCCEAEPSQRLLTSLNSILCGLLVLPAYARPIWHTPYAHAIFRGLIWGPPAMASSSYSTMQQHETPGNTATRSCHVQC